MDLKQKAAKKALEFVESGMVLGLGTGSTTRLFIDMLGEKIQSGELVDIAGVPTSEFTANQARKLNIPLTALSNNSQLDLAVDGADEVDPELNLIKGLGRALLREKIIEVHADRFIVIVDESKLVPMLGSKVPLPVEILPFEVEAHVNWLNTLGCRSELWLEEDGSRVVTDNGNNLARCFFESGIADPYELARLLSFRPGVIEHGLFLDMASQVIVATENGISVLERK